MLWIICSVITPRKIVRRRYLKYLLFVTSLLTVVLLYGSSKILNKISLETKDHKSQAKSSKARFEQTFMDQTRKRIRPKEYFSNLTEMLGKNGNTKSFEHVHGSMKIGARVEFPGMPDPCPNGKYSGRAVEDILCTKMPQFLPSYKNPCWRQDGRLRCLPYFHIIGVPKSATTDLYSRLVKHPQVVKNRGLHEKETWFWAWRRYLHVNRTYFGFPDQPNRNVNSLLKVFGFVNKYKNESRLMTFTEYINTFNVEEIEKNAVDGYHTFITGHGDPMDFTDFHWNYKIPQNDPKAEELVWTTPYLIKHVNPGVKLILMLRDPVERLYSYYFFRNVGNTSMEFHSHVIESMEVWSDCIKFYSYRHCLYDANTRKRMKNNKDDIAVIIEDIKQKLAVCLLSKGQTMDTFKGDSLEKVALYSSFYSSHLKEWLKVFPREQILILRTEDYRKAGWETLQTVFDFLNLSRLPQDMMDKIIHLPRVFVTDKKVQAGAMLPETRRLLVNFYRNSTKELALLLNDNRFTFTDTSFRQADADRSYGQRVFFDLTHYH